MSFTCNICCEDIQEDRLVTLKCNPKHIFCYDCIFDWFQSLTSPKKKYLKEDICMCPMCKKFGGYLPLMTPHTIKIMNIHIGPVFHDTICYVKDCNYFNMYHIKDFSTINNTNNLKQVYLCDSHYEQYAYSATSSFTLKDDSVIQTKGILCQCTLNTKMGTMKCTLKKSITITVNEKSILLCESHHLLYKNKCTLNCQNGDEFISPFESENSICTSAMSSRKYGYCMKSLVDGKCTVQKHGGAAKSTKKKVSPSQSEEIDYPLQNIQITFGNICTSQLKNGSGFCNNKAKYGEKCGIHKLK